jgi:putative membrane protein
MREATGSIVGELVRADLLRLSAYAAASLVVGLSLKRIINRASAAMVARARESRLIH